MEDMEVLLKGHVSGRRGGILRYQPELSNGEFLIPVGPDGVPWPWERHGYVRPFSSLKRKRKKNEDEYLEF